MLLKGTVERQPPTGARVRASVTAGADYLVRALKSNGLYRYYYDPLRNRNISDPYNWPRHAGTSYSLALVGRLLNHDGYVEAAGRALEKFEKQLVKGLNDSRCLMAKGKCYLGSSALGLLALAEYRELE